MKKTVTIISIVCVLIIAVGILILTGTIDIRKIFGDNKTAVQQEAVESEDPEGDTFAESADSPSSAGDTKTAILWIDYMDTCVMIDRNGTVTGTSIEKPADVMQLSGVDITKMVKGEAVEVDDLEAFEYGMDVASRLVSVGITDKGEIFIASDHSAIVYLKKIKILLGKNEDLLEKLEALRKFYNKVIVLEGTLDMQEVSRNKMGYTFKTDTGESKVTD